VSHVSEFRFATLDEVRTRTPPDITWLWDGYLAAGGVTLLTSRWKTGKTTLLSVLLAKTAAGGTLAGRAVRAGHVAVVSEEGEEHWAARDARLHFGADVRLLCRPFRGRPTPEGWNALVGSLAELRAAGRLDWAVIDPLASFLPGRSENDAAGVLDFLHPLQQLTAAGAGVLVLHHPSKQATAPGRLARGSGALTGAADILIEMDALPNAPDGDRRRRLWAFSRHAETPRQLVIELSADGTDYAALGDFVTQEQTDYWPVLLGVLEDAPKKLTRRDVLARWPADHVKPSDVTLWRWLTQAVTIGRVRCEGSGRLKDPFVYWLDGMEEKWANSEDALVMSVFARLDPIAPMSEVLGLRPPSGGPTQKGGET
jgi:hypothetical protein